MLYAKIRLVLVLLFLILGVVLHIYTGIESAWYLYLASFLLLITHFLFGNIWAAYGQLRKGNINEADQMVNSIKRPQWLLKQHRAYYFFIKGMIALQRKLLDQSEQHLQQALELGLRTNNDKALVSLNLAHINYTQNKRDAALQFLEKAKSFDSNDLLIKEHIGKLEQALK